MYHRVQCLKYMTFIYCRAVLLNILGVVVLLVVTCLAGIVLFAFYNGVIGCDPLANGEVSNSNQVRKRGTNHRISLIRSEAM